MRMLVNILVIVVAVSTLVACGNIRGPSGLWLRSPPTLAPVDVTNTLCIVNTQTTTPTCPFIGPSDPPNFVCQSPSVYKPPTRLVEWTSADGDFTLEFPDGHPFVNTLGRCKISTANSSFTCVIKGSPKDDPLPATYKYNVVFVDPGTNQECRLDPYLILTR